MDLIIGILLAIVLFTIYWYMSRPTNLPPGPMGLPILGSILETWNGATCCKKLAELSEKYGSIYTIYIGNQLVLVLADFDAIQEALVKQGDAFLGRPHFPGVLPKELSKLGLGNSEGELWKAQRRFALHTLRNFGLGRSILESRINDEVEVLLRTIGMRTGQSFDVAPLLDTAVANVVSLLIYGKRFDRDDPEFVNVLASLRSRLMELKVSFLGVLALSQAISLLRFLPTAKKITASAAAGVTFIKAQIPRALHGFRVETDEPTNYVQAFYKARFESDNWTFSEEQLVASVSSLFIGGAETTSTTLRWAIFYMCHYPEMQEDVHREIVQETGPTRSIVTYSDRTKLRLCLAVLMEVQRVANVLPISVLRRTMAPCKLRGYDIPEDTVVAPVLGSVLYDARVYPNPGEFDPSRFMNKDKNTNVFEHLIPFSIGKRDCIGKSLARPELFLFFVGLFAKYRFRFSPNVPLPLLKTESATFRAPPDFEVRVELRDGSNV